MKRLLVFVLVFCVFALFGSSCYAYGWDDFDDCWYCGNCESKNNTTEAVCSGCGQNMPRNKVFLKVYFHSNFLFSKYDVNVYLDNKPIDHIKHGASMIRRYRFADGAHTIRFEKVDDASVFGEAEFVVESDMDITYEIKATSKEIRLEKTNIEELHQKYDVTFERSVIHTRYYLAFDMDNNEFKEMTTYSFGLDDEIKKGTFTGDFKTGITLHYPDGTSLNMIYVFEDYTTGIASGLDIGCYLYPLDEDGVPEKRKISIQNYMQYNSYKYEYNE